MTAEVVAVRVARRALTAQEVPALRELYGLERLPLADARVEIELRGVPTAVVNALRRAVLDEMPGHALQVPPDGFDAAATTESFMLPQFVNQRLALIPLRPQVPAEVAVRLRLRLAADNPGPTLRAVYTGDLEVAAGAMPEPLFNPTFTLCTLQPGKSIRIEGIRIASGFGRDDAAFMVTRRAAYRHLDLPQHSPEDTHDSAGAAVDLSGYKVSCLVADPRHHLLTATVPATGPDPAEARAVFADACAHLIERLRLVQAVVGGRAEGRRGARGARYTVVDLESGLAEGLLRVPGETYTLGELLRRAVYERTPDIASVVYDVVAHENLLSFSLRHAGDVTRVLLDAAQHCVATFEAIQRGIAAAR
jgi:DNA-directed RNA polymerase subunit L